MTNLLHCIIGAVALAQSASAFSPSSAHRNHCHLISRTTKTTGPLYSITFEPPEEDNCEVDGSNCEESVFAQKRRERMEHDQAIKDRYQRERGITLTDVDLYNSVDQYQNAPTGGDLIPGVHLTALCEDD